MTDFARQFAEYVDNTDENRKLCERDRDYRDHKQWTSSEAQVLLTRGQAAVVMNRIAPKVDFLTGLERRQRVDPKAFPRTPKHEQDSEAVTDALRFVADNNDFDQTASEAFETLIVEGTAAAIVEVEKNPRGEFEILIREIPWDRFYYDVHSRRKDFADAMFMGISTWLDLAVAQAMFPGKKDDLESAMSTSVIDETFEDRPRWVDTKRKRVRINEHYYKEKGIWHQVFFTDGVELTKPKPCPFKDEYGEPYVPIEAVSLYVDRDNQRYGAVRGMIHPQDEINHRRSKALHMLSSVRMITDPGVFKSATETLNKLKSGSAVIEKQNDGEFTILDNGDFTQGQLVMLQEAKNEIDTQGANSALQGDASGSGRAIQSQQQGGLIELGPLFDIHRAWKRRIYRQVWYRIKQFWDEEKWIRVTDDERNVRFAALNKPVTARERIAEEMGIPPEQVEQALMQMGATVMPGALDRVEETRAQVSELDVDIIINESPDVVSIQQEQFAEIISLAQVYGPEAVPFSAVLKLSSLRNKDEVLQELTGQTPEAAQMLQMQQQAQQEQSAMQQMEMQGKLARETAAARKDNALADRAITETQLALSGLESIG